MGACLISLVTFANGLHLRCSLKQNRSPENLRAEGIHIFEERQTTIVNILCWIAVENFAVDKKEKREGGREEGREDSNGLPEMVIDESKQASLF